MQDRPELNDILKAGYRQEDSGIWVTDEFAPNPQQAVEIDMRENVAGRDYKDYLDEVSNHHSVDVMDSEVAKTIAGLPDNAWILDVGGCWGWHWRGLAAQRADISVIILDFVKSNLLHAREILAPHIGRNVHLVHGDATDLPVRDAVVDLYWSVQCLQHIPQLDRVVENAHRVLKPGGVFRTYDLNFRTAERILYHAAGRPYGIEQSTTDMFLRRSTPAVDEAVARRFGSVEKAIYSEILFQPNLRLAYRRGSLLGRLDRIFSSTRWTAPMARQRMVSARKALGGAVR